MTTPAHPGGFPRPGKPVGAVTRGTTHPNRLRRMDRWAVHAGATVLRRVEGTPLVVDLGYGASGTTVRELHRHVRQVRSDVRVTGIEIEPDRVESCQHLRGNGLDFQVGGFEIPVEGRPHIVRAANVLRQYDETQVVPAWQVMLSRLAPGGIIIEGTCDEIGRLASWITLDAAGPATFTTSMRLGGLDKPSAVAPRLPKALIHHNVPGTRIHAWLSALDEAWDHAAGHSTYGVRQRFLATVKAVRDAGWPVLDGPSRWRLGEVSVDYACVAPPSGADSSFPSASSSLPSAGRA